MRAARTVSSSFHFTKTFRQPGVTPDNPGINKIYKLLPPNLAFHTLYRRRSRRRRKRRKRRRKRRKRRRRREWL